MCTFAHAKEHPPSILQLRGKAHRLPPLAQWGVREWHATLARHVAGVPAISVEKHQLAQVVCGKMNQRSVRLVDHGPTDQF